MPVVPFTNPRSQSPTHKPIDQTFLIMAAADLHEAERLFEPTITEEIRQKGKQMLKNPMADAQDPYEGDMFAPDKYNTVKAAEGIRKYEDDR